MKPCWPVHTFKNCLQHDSGLYTGETFAIPSAVFSCFVRNTRDQSQRVPCRALGDQSFWNVSPVTWTPNFNRWPWFRILACLQNPPPLRKNRSGGAGGGCAHWLPDFKAQDSGFHKPAKISWIPKSGLPYTGAITFISQPCLFLIWNIVVNLPKGSPPKALKNLPWAPGHV